MMKLDLDFHRAPRPSAWGWALLVAGLALAAALLGLHEELATDTARHQAALRRIEARLPGAGRQEGAGTGDDAALAAARQALARAQRPWNQLLATLEAADDPDTAVLAITPDAARGQVKIHAEARHLAAMLAYHQRLQASAGLRQVSLVDHELVPSGAETPVRFHITARWGDGHGGP